MANEGEKPKVERKPDTPEEAAKGTEVEGYVMGSDDDDLQDLEVQR